MRSIISSNNKTKSRIRNSIHEVLFCVSEKRKQRDSIIIESRSGTSLVHEYESKRTVSVNSVATDAVVSANNFSRTLHRRTISATIRRNAIWLAIIHQELRYRSRKPVDLSYQSRHVTEILCRLVATPFQSEDFSTIVNAQRICVPWRGVMTGTTANEEVFANNGVDDHGAVDAGSHYSCRTLYDIAGCFHMSRDQWCR